MPFLQPEMQASILGGWDLAVCSCLFLQGVLCTQFANYMTLNKRDTIRMKLFVAGLALLTTLKSLQSLAIMWIQNVILFGDAEAGSNIWVTHWVWRITLILEATTAFYVQMFFCRRLWTISSRNTSLAIICGTLFLGGLVSGVYGTVDIFTNSLWSTTRSIGTHLGVVLCGDLLLTGSTIFCLLRHSHECAQSRGPTATILSRLCRVTLQSAAPAALCALINFVADMRLNATTWTPGPVPFDFIGNTVLPQLHAWSAMWTLNSREEIGIAAGNCSYTVDLKTSAGGSSDSENTRHQHHDNPGPLAKDQLDDPPGSMA
ncbi:hypothetical protein DFH08DRAFT_359525 [Mycena albidolilacea]|uniref:DUF6534 domain-containing protein n=1 Tax=Mycena albidolilacea TaxID=1033008 RepID=A0AAD7F202_9AGAR|nr:hypothetical protein DFH08DRAFT_359525 [Mycena albidolilacea]